MAFKVSLVAQHQVLKPSFLPFAGRLRTSKGRYVVPMFFVNDFARFDYFSAIHKFIGDASGA